MARIALGDQAAFAELYAQTSSHLYGVAMRILKDGALAVLPATGHVITRHGIDTMIDFFDRQAS